MYNARGFEHKGRDNNPYKMMLRNMNFNTNKEFIKQWLKNRVENLSLTENSVSLTYKGKQLEFKNYAEAVYKLIVQHGCKK